MEEESHDSVLLKALINFGISIPDNLDSIEQLDPHGLVSISTQCLNIIINNNNTSSSSWFPTCLPDSMLEQFKICTDVSVAFKDLGFPKDFTFQQFLYPSEEDKYKLIDFLVEKLSSSALNRNGSNGTKSIEPDCVEGKSESLVENVPETRFVDHRLEAFESACTNNEVTVDIIKDNKNNCRSADVLKSKARDHSGESGDEVGIATWVSGSKEQLSEQKKDVSGKMDNVDSVNDSRLEQVPKEQVSEIRNKIEISTDNEDELNEEAQNQNLDLLHLEDELEFLKAAVEMVFDDNHPSDFFISKLNKEIESWKTSLHEKEMQRNTLRKDLEEKKRSLEELSYDNKPELQEEFQKLKEVKRELDSISLEIRKREDEFSELSSELETLPKQESRRSHIQRIQEITKNSRKQDADIERILKETRELHLESNFIQERLHRTYAVTDETVFREAKKDQVGRQAYRLLTSIHENFEKIFEIIMSTDRVRREIAEHEKKLAVMASRNLNADKLQADLDAIIKENESLEQQLRDS